MTGRCGISAQVIADSIFIEPESGIISRITTMELEYPRFVHAEFMTHRMFSRNAASSRAIPVERQIELIQQNTAMPVFWGKNKPGMTAVEECDTKLWGIFSRETVWKTARNVAIFFAKKLHRMGLHKQIVNRILEPFAFIKVVVTATEFDNFWYLRRHPDAQPEINELANVAYEARENSVPTLLKEGSWHTPYYGDGVWTPSCLHRLEDALAISSSCAAQVSYRKTDTSLEKARDIFLRLVDSKPVHASPFEHQATPITERMAGPDWAEGITHKDRNGDSWSGNFKGWIQHRQLIQDHVCHVYENPY